MPEKKFYKLKSPNKNSENDKRTMAVSPEIKSNSKQNQKILTINIGIDFGTCFSKVCFSDASDSYYFVKFHDSEYKESVVYYDYAAEELSYLKPGYTGSIAEIKYFKYSIIDDNLPKNTHLQELNYEIKPEMLCCIFFLACLIKESKAYAKNYYSRLMVDFNFEGITLGVPIDNYEDENKALYDKILYIAYELSNSLSSTSISIRRLYEYYLNERDKPLPQFKSTPINTLPELYAESLAFLQSSNVPMGVYTLVDIGGGTVDIAIFYKEAAHTFNIISKLIKPLGIEIVSHKIACDTKYINKIKIDLRDKKKLIGIPYIFEKEEEYLNKLYKEAFAITVDELKNKKRDALVNISNGLLKIIICGGGANHKWYEEGIQQKGWELKKILDIGFKFELTPVNNLLPGAVIINNRLLIAYTLSQPIESIPELDGYPWHFEKSTISLKDTSGKDSYWEGQDKQKEIYGEPV